jgi:deazaflavin-dependent oxidoreductase (nitroreductase family)
MSKDNKRLRTFVSNVVNPVLRYAARSSHGPFALLRHVGRKSGKPYEIPIMVWRVADGFVIELTYGRDVDWLRNLQAAAQGSLRWHQREYVFQIPVFIDRAIGLRALPPLFRLFLRHHDFVKLADQPVG